MVVLDRYAFLSMAAAVASLGIKAAAYFLTSSVGLLADALESTVNLAAAVLLLVALRGARKPADRTHAYGHGKLEFLVSGAEGLLVLAAAAGIALAAFERLQQPVTLTSLDVGMGCVLLAAGINGAVGWVLLRAGRRHRSLALEADARHLFTDVASSAGLLVALAIMWTRPDWWIVDPVVAWALAGHIAWTGGDIVLRSIHGLLDAGLDDDELAALDGVLRDANVDYHALRTRRAGRQRFVDFHLLVPGHMSVQESHALCSQLEASIERRLPGTQTVIHVEPRDGHTESAQGQGVQEE
ncbi:MAG: cation diffusion facilitator family transporter [Desulfomicrobiaceae bacterium]